MAKAVDETGSRRLLLLGCSARKKEAVCALKAWDLYDGVAFRVVKAAQRKRTLPASVDIMILSAKHGLIHPCRRVRPYNEAMTANRARELGPEIRAQLSGLLDCREYDEVLVVAGKTYVGALQPFGDWCPGGVKVIAAPGRIGEKLHCLKLWTLGT